MSTGVFGGLIGVVFAVILVIVRLLLFKRKENLLGIVILCIVAGILLGEFMFSSIVIARGASTTKWEYVNTIEYRVMPLEDNTSPKDIFVLNLNEKRYYLLNSIGEAISNYDMQYLPNSLNMIYVSNISSPRITREMYRVSTEARLGFLRYNCAEDITNYCTLYLPRN